VVASIDRDTIELNESFTLKVLVDTAIDREPDAAALNDDFEVLTRSELSNTTIINGQISRSRTWTYVLMAKREGELTIPPIAVGNERSQPLSIRVAAQRVAVPGEADIFLDAEVDFPETYVQAQVLYRLKVYRAVATRQPRLSEPEISGVDVLVEAAAEERSYEALINGKSYTVNERVYALFPQASGQINIAPARFEARVLADGRITGRKVFQSDAVTINIKPIPPPPPEFPDAVWFPAKSVELTENWSRDTDSLRAGEPITRHVTVTALGQLSTQIPIIEPIQSDAVKIYPDKPELRVTAAPGGLLAIRKDQYAIIGVEPGDVLLPDVELPWWNIEEGEWQVARLPATTIGIQPSADALPVPAAARAEQPVRMQSDVSGNTVIHSNFWRRVSEALAVAWLLTLVAWWVTRRPLASRQSVTSDPRPAHKEQTALLKEARRAAAGSNANAARSALLEWARLQ
ncbi:MAG TPA: BatD family protein, partial [Woeseiaceae bacterium]